MDCNEARALVPSYVDGELGLSETRAVEMHVQACAVCREDRDMQQTLKTAVATHATYARAPAALAARIAAAVAASPMPGGRVAEIDNMARGTLSGPAARPAPVSPPAVEWLRWLRSPRLVVAAAALSLASIVWTTGAYLALPSSSERLESELLTSHVRSLVSGHGMDVASSDQHTVKPWFDGKIDYAPPVTDLADAGFPLLGGRVDYVDHRYVAALVYKRRLHTIDVYLWPDAGGGPTRHATKDGYELLGWNRRGIQYWAIADVDPAELESLRAALSQVH